MGRSLSERTIGRFGSGAFGFLVIASPTTPGVPTGGALAAIQLDCFVGALLAMTGFGGKII